MGPEGDVSARRGWWRPAGTVLLIAYPPLVYYGLTHWSSRVTALALACVLLPALLLRLRHVNPAARSGLLAVPLVTVAALLLAFLLDQSGFVLVVPVAINALLLLAFGATLRRGRVPMIERFARAHEPRLSEAKQRWCRQWTAVWCAFFVVNGGIALVLALTATLASWTLWNGLLSYVVMGLLLAAEWIARRMRFRNA